MADEALQEAEAERLAQAEGLTLVRAVSLTGFKVNGIGLNVVKRIVHKNSKKKVGGDPDKSGSLSRPLFPHYI